MDDLASSISLELMGSPLAAGGVVRAKKLVFSLTPSIAERREKRFASAAASSGRMLISKQHWLFYTVLVGSPKERSVCRTFSEFTIVYTRK
tara:strand:+ start:863 stop:1135 length:273 start_codon:yes stop_codon:yes gene_type:complete